MTPIFRSASVSLLALAAASCTANPTALNKPNDVPPAFTAPVASDAPVWPTLDWWTNFKADELPPLEAEAKAQNLNLAEAAAAVVESEASANAALAPLMPSLGVSGSGARRGPNPGAATGPGQTVNSFSAGLSASYQLDLFGANQDKLRQADESLRASRYAEQTTAITIESSVADEYFTILALREEITLAKQNIASAQDILKITQAKVINGVSSNLDLASQQATVAGQEARLPSLIESEREARYALAILLGRAPEGFDVKGNSIEDIASPAVTPGLPSALIARRPDVAEAEAQLYAAHANLDASRAAFFPQISLTGTDGYGSVVALASLVNPANLAWTIGTSITETIFDGGLKAANNDLAKAQQDELLAAYRNTVFTAFSDVETAIGQVASENDQLTAVVEEERAAAEELRLSELEYKEGTVDITTVDTAQQTEFSAQDTLVTTKLARLEANVSLYNNLGGGWTQEASDAAYEPQLNWWPL